MKKRYWTAIIAALMAILAIVQRELDLGDQSEKASLKQSNKPARCMVDVAMNIPNSSDGIPPDAFEMMASKQHHDVFLSFEEDGLGYYYGAYIADAMSDQRERWSSLASVERIKS